MSVDIESLILANGLNPRNYVTTPIFTGSVVFLASDIRALNLRVGFDPLPQNPYHGEVWGNIKPNRFSSTQKRGLLSSARWYVALPNVDLQ